MLEDALSLLSSEERKYIDDLCRYSIFNIVRVNEFDDLINNSTFDMSLYTLFATHFMVRIQKSLEC